MFARAPHKASNGPWTRIRGCVRDYRSATAKSRTPVLLPTAGAPRSLPVCWRPPRRAPRLRPKVDLGSVRRVAEARDGAHDQTGCEHEYARAFCDFGLPRID